MGTWGGGIGLGGGRVEGGDGQISVKFPGNSGGVPK